MLLRVLAKMQVARGLTDDCWATTATTTTTTPALQPLQQPQAVAAPLLLQLLPLPVRLLLVLPFKTCL